jgi:hypothetical protein
MLTAERNCNSAALPSMLQLLQLLACYVLVQLFSGWCVTLLLSPERPWHVTRRSWMAICVLIGASTEESQCAKREEE